MSSEAWQEIAVLLALSPWIAFAVAVVWCKVLELRDSARTAKADERPRPARSGALVERRPSTTL